MRTQMGVGHGMSKGQRRKEDKEWERRSSLTDEKTGLKWTLRSANLNDLLTWMSWNGIRKSLGSWLELTQTLERNIRTLLKRSLRERKCDLVTQGPQLTCLMFLHGSRTWLKGRSSLKSENKWRKQWNQWLVSTNTLQFFLVVGICCCKSVSPPKMGIWSFLCFCTSKRKPNDDSEKLALSMFWPFDGWTVSSGVVLFIFCDQLNQLVGKRSLIVFCNIFLFDLFFSLFEDFCSSCSFNQPTSHSPWFFLHNSISLGGWWCCWMNGQSLLVWTGHCKGWSFVEGQSTRVSNAVGFWWMH